MSGWLKLHRQLQDNPLWRSEPFTRGQAWVDMLMTANHAPSYFYLRGNRIDVGRGVVARSKVELAGQWKWSRGKVLRFLLDLEKDGQVVQQTVHNFTLITLCNYEEYQKRSDEITEVSSTTDDTTDDTTGSTTDGQQTVHIQEGKKQQECKELLLPRSEKSKQPDSAIGWAGVFVSDYGYSLSEAQSASTMPMFAQWVEWGITLAQVQMAMQAAEATLGERPGTPKYLAKSIKQLRKVQAAKVPANHGGFEERDYSTGKYASRMKQAGASS